jgi:hypothetical protein
MGQVVGLGFFVLGMLVLKPLAELLVRAGMARVEASIAVAAVPDPTGKHTARYSGRVRIIGRLVFATYMAGAVYYMSAVEPSQRLLMAGIAGPFLLLALYIVVDFEGSYVTWDDRAIISATPWRRPRAVEWANVATSRFDQERGTLEIKGIDGTTIRLQKLMSGIPTLRAELRSRAARRDALAASP